MPLQKRLLLDWALMRARALAARRVVKGGLRVVCQRSGWVRLEPFEILGPAPNEVLVRGSFSAVSPGTERAQYSRLPNTDVVHPYTPGYSGVGIALAVGGAVDSIRPGDRVAGQIPHASVATVKIERCLPVPPGVPDQEASFVTLGVIAIQGVRKAGIRFGDRVAVLGRGVLGILVSRVARLAGPSEVVVLGRRHDPETDDGEPVGRFDVILDVTGNPDAVNDAAALAVPGGRIVLIGSSRGASPPLSQHVATKPVEIFGAHAQMLAGKESLPGRWTFLDEARLYMDWVLGGRLAPFERSPEIVDPREAWRFYRRLARAEPPVGAAGFDWGLLPESSRSRAATFLPPRRLFRPEPERVRRSARTPRLARRSRSHDRGDEMRATWPDPSRKLGVAFLGCGEIALQNARAVAESSVAEVRWAVDTQVGLARDLADRWGGRAGTDIPPVLDDSKVDAVFICTPHHLHAPLGLQAMAAGKHVLVEKPTARSVDEARTMTDAARSAGVVLSTCYPMRFLPEVEGARALVREGALGRVLGARIAEHIHREMSYWFGGSSGRSRSSWRARRETSGGGVLLMNLCHHLDLLFHLTGLKVARVYCESDRFAAPGDVEDLVAITLRMTDGAIASLDASTCAPGGGERAFQIWGTDGQVALDEPPRFLSLRRTSLGPSNDWVPLSRGAERSARRDFVRAFAGAVLGGSANPVPVEEALAVQIVIDAAYRSAERGESIDLSSGPESSADVASHR